MARRNPLERFDELQVTITLAEELAAEQKLIVQVFLLTDKITIGKTRYRRRKTLDSFSSKQLGKKVIVEKSLVRGLKSNTALLVLVAYINGNGDEFLVSRIVKVP